MKRKDECLFCGSRKCYTRVVRLENPRYDEIACDKHSNDLYTHSDTTLGKGNGIYRHYISGSARHKRGERI